MKYWLTVHWPRLEDGSERYPLRVWLQDGHEAVGEAISAGDRVLVYETQSGPPRRIASAAGTKRRVRLAKGRQGIVAVAQATGRLVQDPTFEKFEYGDGRQRWWCWHAPLAPIQTHGHVSRAEVNRVLGFDVDYPFRGFGTRKSGLKEITKEQYLALVELFQRPENCPTV